MLNLSKGNMYDFVTHTFNIIKGKCEHGCSYCYMNGIRKRPATDVRFDETEFNTDLGRNNFIFVGSSCDDWSQSIPTDWINKMLDFCNKFDNRYLLQSKNPKRFLEFLEHPLIKAGKVVFCTTIETNRRYPEMGMAPDCADRAEAMAKLSKLGYECYVTIEPVMDFDLEDMTKLILKCSPKQVNIGMNTYDQIKLTEPEPLKVLKLAKAIHNTGVKVVFKDNIKKYLTETANSLKKVRK